MEGQLSPGPPSSARRYFVSAPIDFALISGLSFALFGWFLFFPAANTGERMMAAGVANVLLNWPHFAATSFRLYGSRKNAAQFPATAIVAPLLAGAGIVGALLSPLVLAPAFFRVFLLWSFFHFSGQTLGITFLYARKAGFRVGGWARWALSGFVYLTFLSWQARADVSGQGSYFGVALPRFGLPAWAPPALELAMAGFGVFAAALLAESAIRQKRLPPLMVVMPALTQLLWFGPGTRVPAFYEFVQAFHSVQYLLIAWSMHLRETARPADAPPGFRQVALLSGRWVALNLLGGAALFWLLPRAVGFLGANPILAIGVVSAGVQIHHFFVDGVIWKLKSGAVASPLLAGVGDLFARRTFQKEPAEGSLVAGSAP